MTSTPPAHALGPRGTATSDPALAVRGVAHRYGTSEVLHGIDLAIEPGELVALLGPSGSGKTTLLAVAGGLLTPTAGAVHLGGHDLYRDGKQDPDAARRAAFILQAACTIGFLTVEDNLLVRSIAHGQPITAADRRRADDLLERVDLADKAHRHPDELSGGERQRTCIAAALYTRAPVLLADEPTAALDRQRGRAVIELLAEHARTHHAAVLAATHDERTLDLFDRVVHIEDGALRSSRRGS